MKTKLSEYGTAFAFFVPVLSILLLTVVSCGKKTQAVPEPRHHSPGLITAQSPYEYPVGGNNELAKLGRVLFYDKNLSGDKSVSCGSCHKQEYGFGDNTRFSIGANGLTTPRNTHPITKMNNSHFWDGKNQLIFSDTLGTICTPIPTGYNSSDTITCSANVSISSIFKNPVTIPFLTNTEMDMRLEDLSQRLAALPYYPKLFTAAFPNESAPINEKNILSALGVFMDNIVPSNSRFNRVIAAGGTGFSPEEMDGWNIFTGKGKCNLCHQPNNAFAGKPGQFEDIGLSVFYTDEGRKAVSGNNNDAGRFHIPSLMNVEVTAPYMHDGRFRTLEEVVDFFSSNVQNSAHVSTAFSATPSFDSNGNFFAGGAPVQQLNLTTTEKANLVAFLKTLTDHTLITDVRFSDPFKH